MIFNILKKLILSSFLLINLDSSAKATEFSKVNNKKNIKITWSRFSNDKSRLISENQKDKFQENLKNNSAKINSNNKEPYQITEDLINKYDQIIIQSDTQSEKNNVLYAKGNVFVSYKGKFLTANNLIYDKSRKNISANGNISLIVGDQIFNLEEFDYNFIEKKG